MNRSKICLALIETTLQENLKQISRYKEHIDMVELRADFLDPGEYSHIHRFPAMAELPVILTFRRPGDGGHFTGPEKDRRGLIEQALAGKFSLVDLEEDVRDEDFIKKVTGSGARIIRSMHDFSCVPADLEARFAELARRPGEIPKAAVMPRSVKELAALVKCAKNSNADEKIIIGMGNYGFATRILAAKLGSYLTFCSAADKNAAPGHVDPEMLNILYRFRQITAATPLYGIIGNPVMHTASPKIHNEGYTELGIDGVYVPFQVDDVKDFFEVVKLLDIKAFSVTVPHKEAVIPLITNREKSLEVIGACNTVVKSEDGFAGLNTDAHGFITPLKKVIPGSLEGMRVTVVGAGGAAKAVVYSLLEEKAAVLIINRTKSKAEDLAARFGCKSAGLDAGGLKLMEEYSDVIVQTTAAGMVPREDLDPVADYTFRGHEVVYEIVYKPLMTTMLTRAKAAGCTIITGDLMLYYQAFAQFHRFTGKEYPVEILGIKLFK